MKKTTTFILAFCISSATAQASAWWPWSSLKKIQLNIAEGKENLLKLQDHLMQQEQTIKRLQYQRNACIALATIIIVYHNQTVQNYLQKNSYIKKIQDSVDTARKWYLKLSLKSNNKKSKPEGISL